MVNNIIVARIDNYNPDEKFGYIYDGRQKYFFHINSFKDKIYTDIGTQVKFTATPPQNGGRYPVAKNIELADIAGLTYQDSKKNVEKFEKISEWQLEAKREFNRRYGYFYHTSEAAEIETGKKCYVVGRKGSGKSAIAEYIYSLADKSTYVHMLNFKNFPFNELYSLEDTSFQRPSQYITLWKYVVYSHVAMSMGSNDNIDKDIRDELYRHFNNKNDEPLFSILKRWTKGNISLFRKENETSWISTVEDLEEVITNYIDKSKYYIMFDALDDDYNKYTNQDSYFQLLTSLFKAVDSINTEFDYCNIKIMPIIFIREDIYNRIQDNDKHKWDDIKITLSWDINKIQSMLAHRLSKTLYGDKKMLQFNEAYDELFSSKRIPVSDNEDDELPIMVFDDIANRTFLRPRDFIMYFTALAHKAIYSNRKKISYDLVKECYQEFSQNLIDELNNEMLVELNNFEDILIRVIKHGLKSYNFSSQNFIDVYDKLRLEKENNIDAHNALNILYKFSIIGNLKGDGKKIFKYMANSSKTRLNFNEIICLHKGLHSYLDEH